MLKDNDLYIAHNKKNMLIQCKDVKVDLMQRCQGEIAADGGWGNPLKKMV